MSEGSSHNSVSAVVFLIVSIVFLFVVHVNGWLFQVDTLSSRTLCKFNILRNNTSSVILHFILYFLFLLPQVPEDPYYAFLFSPIPLMSTLASLVWLYKNHKGVEKGGYKIDVSQIHTVAD